MKNIKAYKDFLTEGKASNIKLEEMEIEACIVGLTELQNSGDWEGFINPEYQDNLSDAIDSAEKKLIKSKNPEIDVYESVNDVVNEANAGSTMKAFGDLVALLGHEGTQYWVAESIKKMDPKKLNTLEKQINTVYKALYKIA